MENKNREIQEDVWIPSMCGRCYGLCGTKVRRVNGVAVKIEGQPGSTQGAMGGLCPKGTAGLQVLYDPNRLNTPLRRTNPEKGPGVDPKWKEITWDEAFAEIVPRLKKIYEDNPKKLAGVAGVNWQPHTVMHVLNSVFGQASLYAMGVGLHCGNGAHPVGGLIHGSWSIVPDFKYCNYSIFFGSSKGHGSGHSAMFSAKVAAEAKNRGMKMVVFDPRCSTSAGTSSSSEWVPIIPGTDAAVILAMCNIIVNELGIIDEEFLKLKTNGPYLVGPDMKYVRENGPARGVKGHNHRTGAELTWIGDDETNKPLVWDADEGKAKVYDDPSIKNYALEGEYEVNGIKCKPSFDLLKEHLKTYSPEMASEVSSVPPETIRRIAQEYATEARVGSTITIDGHTLPYRPVGAVIFRGGQGHENSYHSCFAVNLIACLVGAVEVPGGTTSWPSRTLGYPGMDGPSSLKYEPYKGIDGFLTTKRFGPFSGWQHWDLPDHGEWPIPLPQYTRHHGLLDIQPIGLFKYVLGGTDREEVWDKLGARPEIDMLISTNTNIAISTADTDAIAGALKEIPFILSFELMQSELTEGFADMVLPDACYLEQAQWNVGLSQNFNHAYGMDDWCVHIVQPIVEPTGERKISYNVGLELLERLGKEMGRDLVAEFSQKCNNIFPISEENYLKPSDRPTTDVVGDRVVKSLFGAEHDWEWFKKNGFIRWPKLVEEAYWMWFTDVRVPIYMEYLVHMGEEIKKINKETGLRFDEEHYTPLISWFPCTIHKVDDPKYDLYCYSYRDILHSGSSTMEQPWLDEASRMNPYTYNITMHSDKAREKGIEDGDTIEIETYQGRKARGIVKLLEGQHPQTVGIAATAGHWAKGQPIAKGKGTNFDTLLPFDFEHMDPVCGNIETAVRVQVRKVTQSA